MQFAKLSTAITVRFGPVLDSLGGEYTGAVVADVKISKNNGTPAALNGSATLTHKEVGYYELALTTSYISAVGFADLILSKTTYVAPPLTLVVLPAKVYDSIIAGSDNLETDLIQILGTAPTEGAAGRLAGAFTKWFNVASPTGTVNSIPDAVAGAPSGLSIVGSAMTLASSALQAIWDVATSGLTTAGSIGKRIVDYLTGDIFARLGAPAGASIAADIAANATSLSTLLTRITAARAGYLDNLNVGGAVASNADILALNQSASRRIILTTVGQYERPESGNSTYTIEGRTYDGDGAATNADSTPTLTATGIVSGNLGGNLSAASNPATGVYRWTYTVSSSATSEEIRFDISSTIGGSTFTLPVYTQVANFVADTWTTGDRAKLTAVYDKLPSKLYLTGTTNSDGDVQLNEATGALATDTVTSDSLASSAVTEIQSGLATSANQTTILNRLGAWTGSGINTVLGAFRAIAAKASSLTPTDLSTGTTFLNTTDSLEAIRDQGDSAWGGSGSGSGARTCTLTITDGTNPLQSVTVRVTKGAETYVATTNASGQAVFHLDDGNWTVTATLPLYVQSTDFDTPLTVDGNETATYRLTAISITAPADPGFATLAIRCWGTNGAIEVGVTVKVQVVKAPSGTGEAFDDAIVSAVTAADGYARFTVPKSCQVKYWRGTNGPKETADIGTSGVVYIDNTIGSP